MPRRRGSHWAALVGISSSRVRRPTARGDGKLSDRTRSWRAAAVPHRPADAARGDPGASECPVCSQEHAGDSTSPNARVASRVATGSSGSSGGFRGRLRHIDAKSIGAAFGAANSSRRQPPRRRPPSRTHRSRSRRQSSQTWRTPRGQSPDGRRRGRVEDPPARHVVDGLRSHMRPGRANRRRRACPRNRAPHSTASYSSRPGDLIFALGIGALSPGARVASQSRRSTDRASSMAIDSGEIARASIGAGRRKTQPRASCTSRTGYDNVPSHACQTDGDRQQRRGGRRDPRTGRQMTSMPACLQGTRPTSRSSSMGGHVQARSHHLAEDGTEALAQATRAYVN